MDEGQCLGIWIIAQRLFDFIQVDSAPPIILDHHRQGSAALGILFHTPTEDAILANDDLVTRFQQIDEDRFHASRARSRDWYGQLIFGLEGILKQLFHFIHHGDESRVEMTDSRP